MSIIKILIKILVHYINEEEKTPFQYYSLTPNPLPTTPAVSETPEEQEPQAEDDEPVVPQQPQEESTDYKFELSDEEMEYMKKEGVTLFQDVQQLISNRKLWPKEEIADWR